MRNLFKHILLILVFFAGSSCDKWDLPRDNPNDIEKGISIRHEVVKDDNSDGYINKDERIYLKVFVKNLGRDTIKNVDGTITLLNSSASMYTYKINYNSGSYENDYIAPGKKKYGKRYSITNNIGFTEDYTQYFEVSSTAEPNDTITFRINITVENTNYWVDSFFVIVKS